MWNRQAARDSVREQIPLVPAVPVFGMVVGLIVAESTTVGVTLGMATNVLIFGGASQLAAIVLIDGGGSAVAAVITIALINLRHVMYSAALQDRLRDAPAWFRWGATYFLIDQVFATNEPKVGNGDSLDYRQTYFLTAGLFWWSLWLASVTTGVVIGRTWGDVIPDSWSLEFSAPLLFLSLMVNSIKNRPGLVAAIVSGAVAVALRNLEPQGTGLIIGATSGLTAGTVLDRIWGTKS